MRKRASVTRRALLRNGAAALGGAAEGGAERYHRRTGAGAGHRARLLGGTIWSGQQFG
jgi:hypothetical protein